MFTPMGSKYKNRTVAELAKLLHEEDQSAFEEIHARFYPLLYRHAMGMLHDHELALDVLQDVFTQLWIKRDVIEINTSVKAYLYGITRNVVLRKLDRTKRYESYLNSLEREIDRIGNTTEEQYLEKELSEKIESEIDRLPEKMKEVFKLSITGDFSNKELSQLLAISENTVKSHLNKANKKVRVRISHLIMRLL